MAKTSRDKLAAGLGLRKKGKGKAALFGGSTAKEFAEAIIADPEKVVKATANTIAMVLIADIEANPFNPRTDFAPGPLEELMASIKVHGLVQPITVRPMKTGKYQLISGERRWRASQKAELTEIPAYIRIVDNDQEMLEMALIENIQRENLNPIEVAITYQRLMDECKLTHEQLSERLGKGRSTITNKLGLLELVPDVVKGLRDRIISEGHAKALKGLEKIDQQLFVFKQIKEKGLSVRATESLCAVMKKKPSKKKSKTTNPYQGFIDQTTRSISAFCGNIVQVKVNNKGKGQIVIPIEDFDQLEFLKDKMQ